MWVPVLHCYPIEEVLMFKVNLPSSSTLLLPFVKSSPTPEHSLVPLSLQLSFKELEAALKSPLCLHITAEKPGNFIWPSSGHSPPNVIHYAVSCACDQSTLVSISLVFPECQMSFSKRLLFRQFTH